MQVQGEDVSRANQIGDEPESAWDDAQRGLLALRDGEFLTLEWDGSSFLIVLHIAKFGYLVSGCGKGDRDYFNQIERALGDEPVTAFDGGNLTVFVRYAFVSASLLLKAIKTFCFTGERDRECEWVPEGDVVYE